MKKIGGIAALAVVVLMAGAAWAVEPASVPVPKQTNAGLYLSAEEVPGFMAARNGKVLFVDVRTLEELTAVGSTPLMDANVPMKVMNAADAQNFATEIEARLKAKSLGKSDPVVLMCRSGARSAIAANILTLAGFTQAYSVVDGFEGDVAKDGPNAGRREVNGWKNKGQPWGYTLDKAKLTIGAGN